LVAAVEEGECEVGTDLSGGAGDEDFHGENVTTKAGHSRGEVGRLQCVAWETFGGRFGRRLFFLRCWRHLRSCW
jgi:hypothetical protein